MLPLQRNRELRAKVLSGMLAPADLVRMTPAQLATAAAQRARSQAEVSSSMIKHESWAG